MRFFTEVPPNAVAFWDLADGEGDLDVEDIYAALIFHAGEWVPEDTGSISLMFTGEDADADVLVEVTLAMAEESGADGIVITNTMVEEPVSQSVAWSFKLVKLGLEVKKEQRETADA